MLVNRNLSELFSRNVHPDLFPSIFAVSPGGILMAYSQPIDVRQIRDRAAVTTMLWREQSAKLADDDLTSSESSIDLNALKALTVEFETHNVIVRRIQAGLLLVLVGPTTRKPKDTFKITAEKLDDATYPDLTSLGDLSPESFTNSGDEEQQHAKFTVLQIQRIKADKLVELVEYELRDYVMPDDTQRLANFP